MHKTLLVIRQELNTTFSRRSYLFFAFGIPLLAMLVLAVVKFIQARSDNPDGSSSGDSAAKTGLVRDLEGFVDLSGIIHNIPANMDGKANLSWGLIAFLDEAQAKQALNAGTIDAYYLIPPDYLKTGKIQYVYPNRKSYLAGGQEWTIQYVLNANLLEDDPELADRVWNPVRQLRETSLTSTSTAGNSSGEDCSRPGSACRSNKLISLLPTLMTILLYMTLTISSSMLFNSIATEKENRAIEVLMVSLHPRQLLAGKTIALGFAGLLQTIFWLGTSYISIKMGGNTLRIPANFIFPVDILVWSLLLFFGGYLLYSSLMAGAGALVPRMKEAGIANFITVIPLFFGYLVGLFAPLAQESDAILPIVMSLFPLTAPVVMVMRLTDSVVPLWQVLLSVGLTYLTAWITLQLAGNIFRAQNLLSGQPFSVRRYLRLMAGVK